VGVEGTEGRACRRARDAERCELDGVGVRATPRSASRDIVSGDVVVASVRGVDAVIKPKTGEIVVSDHISGAVERRGASDEHPAEAMGEQVVLDDQIARIRWINQTSDNAFFVVIRGLSGFPSRKRGIKDIVDRAQKGARSAA